MCNDPVIIGVDRREVEKRKDGRIGPLGFVVMLAEVALG